MESYLINVGLSFFGYFVYVAVFYLGVSALTIALTIIMKRLIQQNVGDRDSFEVIIINAKVVQKTILPGVSLFLLNLCFIMSLSFTANRPKLKPNLPAKAATYLNEPRPGLEIKDKTRQTESKEDRDARFKSLIDYQSKGKTD